MHRSRIRFKIQASNSNLPLTRVSGAAPISIGNGPADQSGLTTLLSLLGTTCDLLKPHPYLQMNSVMFSPLMSIWVPITEFDLPTD